MIQFFFMPGKEIRHISPYERLQRERLNHTYFIKPSDRESWYKSHAQVFQEQRCKGERIVVRYKNKQRLMDSTSQDTHSDNSS